MPGPQTLVRLPDLPVSVRPASRNEPEPAPGRTIQRPARPAGPRSSLPARGPPGTPHRTAPGPKPPRPDTEGPPPRSRDAGPSGTSVRSLYGANACGLRAAIALLDVEFNPLAFFKAAVAIRKDG